MLKFSNVSKIFGNTTALDNLNFGVDDHDFLLITGPSGSGKTTLMKLLIREYLPTKGEIYYLGNPLNKLPRRQIPQHRRQIGVVFQDYKLLPDYNIWENIALPLYIANKSETEIEQRVTDLLKLVKLTDKALAFPSQLSGGEAQRISIARSLATGPKLIFADEPTGNLDPAISLEIAELLQKINQLGTTVLLATHDQVILDYLKKTRKIRLEKGKLVEDTQPKIKVEEIKLDDKPLEKKAVDKKPEPKKNIENKAETKKIITTKENEAKKPINEPDKKIKTDKEEPKKKTRAFLGFNKLRQLFGKKKSL